MSNYVGGLDIGEPPDLPPVAYDDADIPDEVPDFGELPDFMPDNFVWAEPSNGDEPPTDYAPPEWAVGLSQAVLDMPYAFGEPPVLDEPAFGEDPELTVDTVIDAQDAVPELVPEPVLVSPEPDNTPDESYGYDPSLDDVQFSEVADLAALPESAANLWDGYYEAVTSGQNLGGSEAELIARAEDMNLVDASFVGYSDEVGHHVSALEVASDPGSGQTYGQILEVASFQDVEQAAALYYDLQGHVADNTLPNYAVADFAAFSTLALGHELDWRQASEQELALVQQDMSLPADEPPEPLMNEMIQEYTGVDLSAYSQESLFAPELDNPSEEMIPTEEPDLDAEAPAAPSLDEEVEMYRQAQLLPADEPQEGDIDTILQQYMGINVSSYEPLPGWDQPFFSYGTNITEREGGFDLELVKAVDGGVTQGGPEDYRVIASYAERAEAEALAHEMSSLQADVQALTGSDVAGWQALASMAYEIGVSNNVIQLDEPLFTDTGLGIPADPFEVRPTAELFAEYEALQQVDIAEPEQDYRAGLDLDL